MTHDEQPKPAEGRWEFRFADQVAPSEVLAEYAEKAFEAIPVPEGEPLIGWNDPRAASFRRAVAAEANKKGRAKRRALEAEAQVQALRQELANVIEAGERLSAEHDALEERFRETYVELRILQSRESAAASGGSTPAQDSGGAVLGSGATGTDPTDPQE